MPQGLEIYSQYGDLRLAITDQVGVQVGYFDYIPTFYTSNGYVYANYQEFPYSIPSNTNVWVIPLVLSGTMDNSIPNVGRLPNSSVYYDGGTALVELVNYKQLINPSLPASFRVNARKSYRIWWGYY